MESYDVERMTHENVYWVGRVGSVRRVRMVVNAGMVGRVGRGEVYEG